MILKFVEIDLPHAKCSHLPISLHLLQLINVISLVRELIEHQLLLCLVADIDFLEYPGWWADAGLVRGEDLGIRGDKSETVSLTVRCLMLLLVLLFSASVASLFAFPSVIIILTSIAHTAISLPSLLIKSVTRAHIRRIILINCLQAPSSHLYALKLIVFIILFTVIIKVRIASLCVRGKILLSCRLSIARITALYILIIFSLLMILLLDWINLITLNRGSVCIAHWSLILLSLILGILNAAIWLTLQVVNCLFCEIMCALESIMTILWFLLDRRALSSLLLLLFLFPFISYFPFDPFAATIHMTCNLCGSLTHSLL